MGAGTGAGTEAKAVAEMGTGTRMGTRTGIEIRVEWRESQGTFEMVIVMGRKTRERGRHQRVMSNQSRKTRPPSETVAMRRVKAQELEARDWIGSVEEI